MKGILLTLALGLFFYPSTAQNFSGIEQVMLNNQKTLGDEQVALVYKDGKLIYQKSIGDFKPSMQASIGESSQWFTAALVLILAQEGKISLDDKVGKYLPLFPKWMKSQITIRQCLSHTTGIEPDKAGAAKLLQKRKFETLEEEANYYGEKRDIVANPGDWFHYNNIGPVIAGRVLEVVTKKKFDRLIQEKLFRPLNMRFTSFSNYTSAISPFDGAKSTANDYMNFLSMLLNNGLYNGKQILTEQSIAEFQKIQTGEALNKFTPSFMTGYSYGLGSWLERTNGTFVNCSSPRSPFVWIDFCKGYAFILLSKYEQKEQAQTIYQKLQQAIAQQLPGACG
jgi:CubicO group peptidase (beta-lactamase class C family)